MTTVLPAIPRQRQVVVVPHPDDTEDALPQVVTRRLLRRGNVVVLGGLLLIAVAHLFNIAGWPAFQDDEGTYFSQAWATTHLGALAPYTYWYDHPPFGWMQLGALQWLPSLFLPGSDSLVAGRVVMAGYTILTAGLVYLLARNVGCRQSIAMISMLMWGLSPLVLFEGRQIYLDNLALPWLMGAFVLATNRHKSLWHYVAGGVVFGMAVLTKETTIIAFPALLAATWRYSYRPTRSFALVGLVSSCVLTGLFYPLMATLRHELLPGRTHVSLWDALAFQLNRAGSGFILTDGSASHGLLQSWLGFDHVLLVAGLLAAAGCLFMTRARFLGLAMAAFVVMALRTGYMPGMYVIAVLPFCALAIAVVLERAASTLENVLQWTHPALIPVVFSLALAGVAVAFVQGNQAAWTQDDNGVHAQVTSWVNENIGHDRTVVVDNTYWNDLVRQGFNSDGFGGALWFYKVDTDPAYTKYHSDGYRGLDYVIVSPTIRQDPNNLPVLRQAIDNSKTVATFGSGDRRVDIMEVLQ